MRPRKSPAGQQHALLGEVGSDMRDGGAVCQGRETTPLLSSTRSACVCYCKHLAYPTKSDHVKPRDIERRFRVHIKEAIGFRPGPRLSAESGAVTALPSADMENRETGDISCTA